MPKKSCKLGTEARRVPLDVRRLVLHEAGYKCSNPACRYPLTLDVHHLYYVSEGGSDSADNLLPLCPNCHTEHHNGNIPTESLRAWKMLLMALNEAFDRRAIDLLLVLAGMKTIRISPYDRGHDYVAYHRISGDGLSDYAGLIASNFADITDLPGGTHCVSVYGVGLTDKGRLFVEAWKRGDQRAAIELMPAATDEIEGEGHDHAT